MMEGLDTVQEKEIQAFAWKKCNTQMQEPHWKQIAMPLGLH